MGWLKNRISRSGMATVIVLDSLIVPSTPSVLAQEIPSSGTGCGYGEGGAFADSLCWIDMSSFDPAQAKTESGQHMTLNLENSFTVDFDAKLLASDNGGPVDITPVKFPTWSGAVFGNAFYTGTPGKPALYSNDGSLDGWQAKTSLSNIKVSQNGLPVSIYSLVVADAESTDGAGNAVGSSKYEGLRLGSDQPLNELFSQQPAGYSPACGREYSGNGTTQVTCLGQDSPGITGRAGALGWYADSPTSISADLRGEGSKQAVAFGVMFANVQGARPPESRHRGFN